MNAVSERDVVVVGGGPAGATTASLLAERGHRVVLLERHVFPRRKPCGEAISPGAVGELAALGLLPRVLELPHSRFSSWTVHPLEGSSFEGRFPAGVRGIGIDRSALDDVLLREARRKGVEVRAPAFVTDLLPGGDRVAGVRLRDGEEIRARLVIGADGLRSVVVRRLGLIRRKPRLRKLALTAHVAGAHRSAEAGALRLHPWGCTGMVEIGGGLCNVVVVLDGLAGASIGSPAAFFTRLLGQLPYLAGATLRSPVLATGPFDCPTRGVAARGVLLVGDAAGYYDPFTGQGIYRALRGARLAAATADRFLRGDRALGTATAEYQRAHRAAFTGSLAMQHAIEAITSRAPLIGAAAAGLRRWPAVADRLVAIIADLPRVGTPGGPASGWRVAPDDLPEIDFRS